MVVDILIIIYKVLTYFSVVVFAYQIIVSLIGYIVYCFKKKNNAVSSDMSARFECGEKKRFAVITSARNEESVVARLITSLQDMNYPKDMYDIYVIADNCTDDTAKIAREHGVNVYERFDDTKRSKGFALEWFFKKLLESGKEYDAFAIFDTDNVVDKYYLDAINYSFCVDHTSIVQGSREPLNPSDSGISGSYAIYFWGLSRFFFSSRTGLKLSGTVGGTGFCFTADVIKNDGGWVSTKTLSEDMEFSLHKIIEGYDIRFVEDAVYYDEHPNSFSQSFRQRMRWSVGTMQCLKLFWAPMVKALDNKERSAVTFDILVFLTAIPFAFLAMVTVLLMVLVNYAGNVAWYTILLLEGRSVLATIVVAFLFGIISTLLSKQKLKTVVKGLFYWPLFILSWMYINIVALFVKKLEWKPIYHSKKAKSIKN